MLAGLAGAAGLVLAPKSGGNAVRHIEFVPLGPGRALVILVGGDGQRGEPGDRDAARPATIHPGARQANFLNARLSGRTLGPNCGAIVGNAT